MTETNLFGEPIMQRSAFFLAPDIRRSLSRRWAQGPQALVIGCNPSDANAQKDDPTVRWWVDWFRRFGFGSFTAMNLWAKVSSDPKECQRWARWQDNGPDWSARDEICYANLGALVEAAKAADQVFVCWGAIAWDSDWIEHVVEEIQSGEAPYPDLWCWGTNADGSPKHPMARGKHRISPDQRPILWRPAR